MAIKKYKPTSPGRRGMSVNDFSLIEKKKPEKSLLAPKTRKAGRGSAGKITTRHRGGAAKRRYRIVDFRMEKLNIPARVEAIEYDPNRSAFLALLVFADGEKRYVIATEGNQKGDKVIFSEKAPIRPGNRLPLSKMPLGTTISNFELFPGKGAQAARSAGSSAKLTALEGGKAHISLPSGVVKVISDACYATVGQVGNINYNKVVIGKAGRARHMGLRPEVRGSAMNPVDHPHGGGEGAQPIGLKHPKTPWGKPALGYKTARKKKRK